MNHARPQLAVLLVASFLAVIAIDAETPGQELRTIIAGAITLSPESPEGSRLAMGYNDALAVLFPKDSPFIQGFEIELKLPQAVLAMPGGFAYELWRRIDPAPDKNRFGYRGDRIITQPLPARAGIVDHAIKQSPYATLLPVVVEQKDFPFLFKLMPVTKGISADIEAAQFQVRIRPILTDEGALNLRLRYPEGGGEKAALSVMIDDRKVDPGLPFMLKAGSHRLHVSSEVYRDESRSFTIEQGRILELVIELQDTMPVLVIEAPDSALVSLDGTRLDHIARPQSLIEAGEHTATCRIGDYTVTRRFTAVRGKTYRLVLSVELQVQESP
jgi:hypothetical protein